MSRYDSGFVATLPALASAVGYSHNLGSYPEKSQFIMECTTADAGYAVGDRLVLGTSGINTSYQQVLNIWASKTGIGLTTNDSGSPFVAGNKSTGTQAVLTRTSWKYKFTCERGW
jgi:hypothetical protein